MILSVPFSFSSEAFSVKKEREREGEKIFSQERRGEEEERKKEEKKQPKQRRIHLF